VTQIAAQTGEFPDDECVALAQRLQAGDEAGPVVALAGRGVFVEIWARGALALLYRPGGLS